MADVLTKNGYKAGSLSVAGVAKALVSKLNALLVLDPLGVQAVNPIPWAEDIEGLMIGVEQKQLFQQQARSMFGYLLLSGLEYMVMATSGNSFRTAVRLRL